MEDSAMGKARQRKTGKLYLDFFDRSLRLREQAALKTHWPIEKNAHRLYLLTAFSNLLMSDKYLFI
jgi:hypothetical protein